MQDRLDQLQLTHTQELESVKAELEQQRGSHAQHLESVTSELAEMSSQHAAAATQLLEVQQQHDVAVSEAQEASHMAAAALAETQDKIQRLQASQEELTQQLSMTRTQLVESRQELDAARGEVKRSGDERQHLVESVDRLQAVAATVQAAKQDLVSQQGYNNQTLHMSASLPSASCMTAHLAHHWVAMEADNLDFTKQHGLQCVSGHEWTIVLA